MGEAQDVRLSGQQGVVLSVVSAGGGAGKSSVCTALAQQCCSRGLSVLLLDGDCQFGDCARMSNDAAVLSFPQVQTLCEGDGPELPCGLVVVAPDAIEYAEHQSPKLPLLARQAAQWFDVVVVNTASVWADPLVSLMESSDRVLFVVGQSASSVLGTKRALDLCLRCGIATGAFLFLLNRCSRHSLFTSIDISCALGGVHVLELREGGAEVEELQGCGLSRHLLRDGNPFYCSMECAVEELLGQRAGTAEEDEVTIVKASPARKGAFFTQRRRGESRKRGKHQGSSALAEEEREEALWR